MTLLRKMTLVFATAIPLAGFGCADNSKPQDVPVKGQQNQRQNQQRAEDNAARQQANQQNANIP